MQIRWKIIGLVVVILAIAATSVFIYHSYTSNLSELKFEASSPSLSVSLPLAAQLPRKKIAIQDAFYVGSKSCQSCHLEEYEEWQQSWHAQMLYKPPLNGTLTLPLANYSGGQAADFNDKIIIFNRIPATTKDGQGSIKISPKIHLFTHIEDEPNSEKSFFFTLLDEDDSANNQTYKIDLVLGGNWEQQFLIKVDKNYYPSAFRWVVADNDWEKRGFRPGDWFIADGTSDGRPRKPEELLNSRSSEARCDGCHRTGFIPKIGANTNVSTAVSGEMGVGCESCHGAGSLHNESQKADDIIQPVNDLNALQQTQLCSQCHHRGSNRLNPILAYPTGFKVGDIDLEDKVSTWHYSDMAIERSNHFWPDNSAKRNRQQWQDFQQSSHFLDTDVSCISCHYSHKKPEEGREDRTAQLRLPSQEICNACHTAGGNAARPNAEFFAGSPMANAGVSCVDCHMSKVGERAGPTLNNPRPDWDVSSHTFRVTTPEIALNTGKPSACQSCHAEGKMSALVLTDKAANTYLFEQQIEIKDLIKKTQLAIRNVDIEENIAKLALARAKLNYVLLDGSFGFHNYEKAKTLLQDAIAIAKELIE